MTVFSARRTRVLLCLVASAATCWLFAGVAQAAPTNTALPTITGTLQQGQVLTLHRGTWTDAIMPTPAITITDQWETCTGSTCSPISPAQTGTTYTLTAADVGHTIEISETATTTTDGFATISSAPTAQVTALPPANTVPPKITGTAQIGKLLTLTQGTWTNSPTITNQWRDCTGTTCTAISPQPAGATYTVTANDVGHTVDVLETATNTGGTASVASNATVAIVAPPTELSAPSISGTPQQGSVLTEHNGTWTGSPTSFSHHWWRCGAAGCAAIPGATLTTYTPTAADLGAAILVAETASNAGGPSAAANSALTGVVTTPAGVVPVPVGSSPPTVSGLTQQGQTLLEGHGTWSNNPGSYGYQWESCSFFGCFAIAGATGPAYTLTAADVGQTILVLETASNSGGSGARVASARTGTVIATSATSLTASSSGPLINQTVTLVATISSSSGNANPSGSLTFFDGTNAIGGCANESFKASSPSITLICSTSFPAGTAGLTAAYTPTAGSPIAASASSVVTINVGKDSTSTSLAITKQVVRLKRATYTATVLLPASNSGPIQPTGSIEFLDGGRPIPGCRSRPLAKLAATCAVKYKSLGRHKISARYSGDSNFASSASPTRSAQIVKHRSGPVTLGFIASTLQWQFQFHPRYTQVSALSADGVVKGTTVVVTCAGRGCPFSRRSIGVNTATATSINLLPAFHKRHLRVGSQITLRIMRPRWIGKYYSFTVRAGQGPLIVLSCLGVGRSRPGLGC